MLYKYQFVKHRKLRELNFHFLIFIRKAIYAGKSAKFEPSNFFHSTFLTNGKIAPKGRENKELHNKFKAFFDVFKKLEKSQKRDFYELIIFSQDIHLYFEDVSIVDIAKMQSDNIRSLLNNTNVFNNLMDAMWNYLKSPNAWEIDKHYDIFYGNLPDSKMCPFCGLNKISDKHLYRSDYDHIAYKADFPMSAINLKNITPSCSECNTKFKTTKNVFYAFDKSSRSQYYYPYTFKTSFSDLNIRLDLVGSLFPNTDESKLEGQWKITILPNDEFTKTWNKIYNIECRYSKLVNVNYLQWNDELVFGCEKFLTIDSLKERIRNFKKGFAPNKLRIEYHIKYAYYDYLEKSMNDILFTQINSMIA
ncbi:hypothetical protein [Chryseobacterium taichungense]|uniref:hypothetical protein n=1 Tax=Chryseobacterium taichungense TaxID=295069 RepID=UPI0028AEFAD6|nr:hypothetical protein [Chryseobacterium taichungense]